MDSKLCVRAARVSLLATFIFSLSISSAQAQWQCLTWRPQVEYVACSGPNGCESGV
jgi:hypothetical protein